MTLRKVAKELSVIPVKAKKSIFFHIFKKEWIPFFKGMTTFCSDVIKDLSHVTSKRQ